MDRTLATLELGTKKHSISRILLMLVKSCLATETDVHIPLADQVQWTATKRREFVLANSYTHNCQYIYIYIIFPFPLSWRLELLDNTLNRTRALDSGLQRRGLGGEATDRTVDTDRHTRDVSNSYSRHCSQLVKRLGKENSCSFLDTGNNSGTASYNK